MSLPEWREVDVDELLSFCGGHLAGYELPEHVRFLTELPKTPIGKHDKQAMAASIVEGGIPS